MVGFDMNRAEVISRLRAIEPELKDRGIAGLFLFGSHARDQQRPDSDVDVFVDKAPGRRFGFEELMGGYAAVQAALPGVEIGFSTREGLSKYVRDEVEREAIRIF
jgi:predicted nucleotidyltransferase